MSCADLENTFTLDYLVREFKHKAKDVVEHTRNGEAIPHDFAYAFFWSILAYKKHLLRNIFDTKECSYDLRMNTAKRNTPFVYTFRNLKMVGETKTSDTLIIGIRGMNKFHDVIATLARIDKRMATPDALKALELPAAKWSSFTEELERVYKTMHPGIFNHSLAVLTMISRVVAETDKKSRIFVHGHSLGASCAAFVAYFLGFLGYTNVSCTCLSGPPVFDSNCPVVNIKVPYIHYYTLGDKVVTTKWISGNRWKSYVKHLVKLERPPALKASLPEGDGGANTNIGLKAPEFIRQNPFVKHTHFRVPCSMVPSFCRDKERGYMLFIEHVFMQDYTDNVKLCKTADTKEVSWKKIDIL